MHNRSLKAVVQTVRWWCGGGGGGVVVVWWWWCGVVVVVVVWCGGIIFSPLTDTLGRVGITQRVL
jgi:hypothetical protein